jgi:hypothetical protein
MSAQTSVLIELRYDDKSLKSFKAVQKLARRLVYTKLTTKRLNWFPLFAPHEFRQHEMRIDDNTLIPCVLRAVAAIKKLIPLGEILSKAHKTQCQHANKNT